MSLPWLIIVYGTNGTAPPVVILGGRYPSRWQKGMEELSRNAVNLPSPRPDAVQKAAAHMSSLGGIGRAKSLSATQRSSIATKAANVRWKT